MERSWRIQSFRWESHIAASLHSVLFSLRFVLIYTIRLFIRSIDEYGKKMKVVLRRNECPHFQFYSVPWNMISMLQRLEDDILYVSHRLYLNRVSDFSLPSLPSYFSFIHPSLCVVPFFLFYTFHQWYNFLSSKETFPLLSLHFCYKLLIQRDSTDAWSTLLYFRVCVRPSLAPPIYMCIYICGQTQSHKLTFNITPEYYSSSANTTIMA